MESVTPADEIKLIKLQLLLDLRFSIYILGQEIGFDSSPLF